MGRGSICSVNPAAAGAEVFAWREASQDIIGLLGIDGDRAKKPGIGLFSAGIVGSGEKRTCRVPRRGPVRCAEHCRIH